MGDHLPPLLSKMRPDRRKAAPTTYRVPKTLSSALPGFPTTENTREMSHTWHQEWDATDGKQFPSLPKAQQIVAPPFLTVYRREIGIYISHYYRMCGLTDGKQPPSPPKKCLTGTTETNHHHCCRKNTVEKNLNVAGGKYLLPYVPKERVTRRLYKASGGQAPLPTAASLAYFAASLPAVNNSRNMLLTQPTAASLRLP